MMEFTTSPKAWGRTRTLALGMGVDLEAALFDGWYTRKEVSALVARCASCANAQPCREIEATSLAEAPAFCPNKSALDALRG